MGLTPDQILHCHWSGYPDGVPPSSSWSENTGVPVEWTKEAITSTLGLKDYSDEVRKLNANSNGEVIWQSPKIEDFDRNWKINFLRITDEGFIILDVFKPGCHSSEQVFVGPEFTAQDIKTYLAENSFTWEKMKEGWAKGADENTPNGDYKFLRRAPIAKTHYLVWEGTHTNPPNAGVPFRVQDFIRLEFRV